MPIVEISAFEHRLDDDEAVRALISRLTDAVCETFGESTREDTWVVVKGIPAAQWGFGGDRRL